MDTNEILDQMQAVASLAEAENRSLTDEEVTTYEGFEAQLQAARKSNEIVKRQEAYQAPVIVGAPAIVKAIHKGDEALEAAFVNYLRTGQKSMELAQLAAQSVGTDTAGGFMVPEGFRGKITDRMKSFGGLSTVAETITTESGNALPWPTLDDTDNEADIAAEGAATAAGADLVFGEKTLLAFKYTTAGASNLPIRVSVELLQDAAFNVDELLSRKMGERIARGQAVDFMTGADAHTAEPQGLLLGSGSPAVTLAAGNAVTYDNLLDMLHAVDPAYRPNAVWIFNDNTLRVIRGLVDLNEQPLWRPDAGLESLPGGSLLGHRVIIDQAAPTIAAGAGNVAAFGDMREAYVIRRVKGVTVIVNPYSRANEGQVEYSAFARADGIVQNANAVAILAANAA